MKKYTQRELCYEAFGDVMRGLGNVAKAGAKLAVPAGAELVKRGKAAVNTFRQQLPVNAIKKSLTSGRTIEVYTKAVNPKDIVLDRAKPPQARRGQPPPQPTPKNYRLTNPSNFKEHKKIDNILLIDFDAADQVGIDNFLKSSGQQGALIRQISVQLETDGMVNIDIKSNSSELLDLTISAER